MKGSGGGSLDGAPLRGFGGSSLNGAPLRGFGGSSLNGAPLRQPIVVTHVISGLELGGAETMLCKLLSATDRARFAPSVISLSTLGPLAPRIAAMGVPVSALNMSRGRVEPRALGRLARGLAARRPHVVHTWMYHADLLGGAMARATCDAKVIWGIRGSLDPRLSKLSSRITARACSATARWLPDRVVSCSERLAETHIERGYERARMMVIPNGFDLAWLRPEEALRAQGRSWVGTREEELLVGIVGRYDPQKDHRTFIRAAAEVLRERPEVRLVMCGPGVDSENRELMALLAQAGIQERTRVMGVAQDPRAVLNALDVLVSSSAYGEGFPNILGEAMACGVPCVTTDVGDAASIVGDTGGVVAAGDWRGLAREILALLGLRAVAREDLGQRARARIEQRFALADVAGRFQDLYLELVGDSGDALTRR
jgi:glycosyltransferase involved in cell wall biosynthesis